MPLIGQSGEVKGGISHQMCHSLDHQERLRGYFSPDVPLIGPSACSDQVWKIKKEIEEGAHTSHLGTGTSPKPLGPIRIRDLPPQSPVKADRLMKTSSLNEAKRRRESGGTPHSPHFLGGAGGQTM